MALKLGVSTLLCLLLVACAGDEAPPAAKPSPAQTFVAGEPCPTISTEESIPQGCITDARGDVDGDGRDDLATVFAQVNQKNMPSSWWLVVETTTDQVWDVTWRLQPGKFSYPRMVGLADATGDGDDEVFVKVSDHLYHSGASPIVGVFGFSKEGLFRYIDERGEPFTIDVGGVSHFGQGAECRNVDGDSASELVKLRVDSATSDRPRTSETVFEWRGQRLVQGKTVRGRITRDGPTDPKVFRYYQFRCGELDPPFPY